jgi:hypothetical protein
MYELHHIVKQRLPLQNMVLNYKILHILMSGLEGCNAKGVCFSFATTPYFFISITLISSVN